MFDRCTTCYFGTTVWQDGNGNLKEYCFHFCVRLMLYAIVRLLLYVSVTAGNCPSVAIRKCYCRQLSVCCYT
ncbi:hypothetical protein MAR_008501 [Mya arenaria]|uniref:Uncharacterized protein n=1 Tax=Mya arenaria TaxID=6604 RepID=A0ABY7DZA6_MYAAR|nr:hypothetical protein MAR_008501 [Mya arenaria]